MPQVRFLLHEVWLAENPLGCRAVFFLGGVLGGPRKFGSACDLQVAWGIGKWFALGLVLLLCFLGLV